MPEAPEVQAHAERMAEALVGRTLAKVDVLSFSILKTFDPPIDGAVGSDVTGVRRRAKQLVIDFANDQHHLVHLMQGGRLRPDTKLAGKPRGGMLRWRFDDGTAWLLTEAGSERKAGVWAVAGDPLASEVLAGLGPEADALDRAELAAVVGAHSKRLHGLLRQQSVISGIGRLLANEICFAARLSPFAIASKLTEDEIDRLHAAIGTVMAAATEHERTLDDIGKSADRPSKVHHRAGQPCVGVDDDPCGDTVRTVEYRRYTVFYCPTHQTDGKILADNTTSKFLK